MRKLSQSLGIAVVVTLLGQPAGAEGEGSAFWPGYSLAPEPNPPSLLREDAGRDSTLRLAADPAPYTIGDPTDEEQLYVELVNRSRANPQAEAERLLTSTDPEIQAALKYYNVDLELVRSQYLTVRAAPPVSLHAQLTAAARGHCADMFTNVFQGHVGTDGSTIGVRITRTGYRWNGVAENVFSYAKTVPHGHAGFEIDWGDGPGGIQSPPGHRNTIHNATYREIGVGVINGTNGSVGPQLVVQEFGMKTGASPFITGVVYYDFNGNQFYDLGEGVGGVKISVGGSSQTGLSARSGGYSVPVPGNGQYTVTFEVPGGGTATKLATVANSENVKVDYVPTYAAPTVSGPSVAKLGRNNTYTLSTVGGATAYDWRTFKRAEIASAQGAESGLGRFTAEVSAGYEPVATGVSATGSSCYHLAHPAPPTSQYLAYSRPVRFSADSQITFKSRLGSAAADQVARVQVREENDATWKDVWSQAGAGSPGESSFSPKSVGMGTYAGRVVWVRLAYTFVSGKYFPQTHNSAGWFIDDFLLTQTEELSDELVGDAGTTGAFALKPTTLDPLQVQVRARLGERVLAWGPALSLTVEEAGPEPATVRLGALTPSATGWELAFQIETGSAGTFAVEASEAVSGPWAVVPGVSVTAGATAGSYRAALPASATASRFYRVQSN